MPTMTFDHFIARVAFSGMLEGMLEVLEDDAPGDVDDARRLADFRRLADLEATMGDDDLTVALPADLVPAAQDVIDNCADNAVEGAMDDAPDGSITINME